MLAELVVDLKDLGLVVGESSGRDVSVFPKLSGLVSLWGKLGVEVSAINLVTADFAHGDHATGFAGFHAEAWWEAEKVFVEDEPYSVSFHTYRTTTGDTGRDALVVTTALSRSDALADNNLTDDTNDRVVIVMSNRRGVRSAVTHARGAAVMLAGTVISDPGLAHVRLEPRWLQDLGSRFATIELDGVEVRDGRPMRGDVAIGTPYGGLEGRDEDRWAISNFAKTVAIFDPDTFEIGITASHPTGTAPEASGVAATIQRLGLGELVHVETADTQDPLIETSVVATLYRYAADYPKHTIVIVSTRASLIIASSDLAAYSMVNPQRFIRLCVPYRQPSFDEEVFANSTGACRVVLEQSQSASLFERGPEPKVSSDGWPVLTLVSNPNSAREDAAAWREETQRHLLILGADSTSAGPADSTSAPTLPISLGGCSDFEARRPQLRPGAVVEGVLSQDGERWIVVSDPIERRRANRTAEDATEAPVLDDSPSGDEERTAA